MHNQEKRTVNDRDDDLGWIKIYRQALRDGWLQNHTLWAFWCYCLLKASHDKIKVTIGYQRIELKPGEFIFGRKKAAQELKTTEQRIRTCTQKLEQLGNITVKSTNKFSIISVCNWREYQFKNIPTNQQLTNNQPTTNQQLTTYKNVKNDKNKEGVKTKKQILTPFDINSQYYKAAKYCTDRILENHPTFNGKLSSDKSIQKHAKLIYDIERLDKISLKEIRKIIDFATSDDFWKEQFQSPAKLRRQNKDGIRFVFVWKDQIENILRKKDSEIL